ncbi:F-box domain-containing protein [Mycena sanguinolenta]|uniref:F-box domain-containing protein n=1 Tax=Mycena sanguinolenta TaxID=230812 RepID=A0A8H6YY92_9AGAR|nr:F-box domain-containing protein [Mycena sanguinolenta]
MCTRSWPSLRKPLRRVTLSKQLWLSLVQDSSFRDALELPPPDREKLENHSTEELIDFVKSAVVGPGSFDYPSATITHTSYKIPLHNVANNPDAQLFIGARYILLQNIAREELYIYDVWSARRIWQRGAQAGTICQVDLLSSAAIARVLITQPVDYLKGRRVHIDEIDLITGVWRQVFELGSATRNFGISRLATSAISGDFFLCSMLFSPAYDAKFILVNWRASTFVALQNRWNSVLGLIPGYIVSTYESPPPHQQVLAVTALDDFSNHWQPLTELNLEAQLRMYPHPATPSTVLERLEYNNHPLGSRSVDVHLTVTPSALHCGAYNISVQAGESPRPPGPPTLIGKIGNLVPVRRPRPPPPVHEALLSYKFTPASSHGRGCELRLVSAQRVSNTTQTGSPRATTRFSGGSLIVSYRQWEWPPRRADVI